MTNATKRPSTNSARVAYAHAGVAAAAMVCTLPGRTHGLGLITEPLLAELSLDRVAFASINFWATLIGASFCVPVGWLLDRIGIRRVLVGTLIALGAVVLLLASMPAESPSVLHLPSPENSPAAGLELSPVPANLFLLILLTRGLGQSALSVISLALVGRAAGRQSGMVIGVYSFLVAVGFMLAFAVVKVALEQFNLNWRELWSGIGGCLIVAGLAAIFFVHTPRAAAKSNVVGSGGDHSFGHALATPAFWAFGIATSFYGLVASGMSLFNQSILEERQFDRGVFLTITVISPIVGLAANLATGLLATQFRLGTLLAAALLVQTAAMGAFPYVDGLWQVYAYAGAMGVAGGMMTVIFFTAWVKMYGPRHLGKIQGTAQLLTVLASAAGPLVLAAGQRGFGNYSPVIQGLAGVSAILALVVWLVPAPEYQSPPKIV
jgi:MFS family permease